MGESLFEFDRALGHTLVAGCDEAGRGCLAGPIVGAAVLLDYTQLDHSLIQDVNDSKKLSTKARERLYPAVIAAARAVAITSIDARQIDAEGIQPANLAVLRESLRAVAVPGARLLSDGFALGQELEHERVIGGDRSSAAIACASIIAKVSRDLLMAQAGAEFPAYGFERHAGYGTKAHLEALAVHGPCRLHRHSYAPVAALLGAAG